MTADVQIFIPVFNGLPYVERTVGSVLSQTGLNIEVVVSDNCSTDGTFEMLSTLADDDSRIRLFRNSENIGMIGNINKLSERITAKYYLMLCADDVLAEPSALSQAFRLMDQHPDLATVYCDMRYIDGKDKLLMRRSLRKEGFFDSDAVLRASIIASRNLFGIPLLHRSDWGLGTAYSSHLSYTADVYHSAMVGKKGRLYHLAEPLIGNRYTGANATGTLLGLARKEFAQIASDAGIELSYGERLRSLLNDYKTTLAKRAFMVWARTRS